MSVSNGDELTQSVLYEEFRQYLSVTPTCLYILTPCYGSMCYTNYMMSLLSTIQRLNQLGLEHYVEFCNNDSLVSRARNNLVARAMNNPKTTHILFIDSDIAWEPDSIIKLILADKHIVGGVYPIKNYDWSSLITKKNGDIDKTII